MTSGDPRKQPGPDGRAPTDQVTDAFPPAVQGVITEFGATVVPFPFIGGKGLMLEASCGPLKINLVLEPKFSDVVCDAIHEAKTKADTGLEVATAMPNGNGAMD